MLWKCIRIEFLFIDIFFWGGDGGGVEGGGDKSTVFLLILEFFWYHVTTIFHLPQVILNGFRMIFDFIRNVCLFSIIFCELIC